MQGMKMADALLGATIKIALEKVASFATDQIGMVMGFKKDLERLNKTVDLILAFVDDAEKKQVEEQAVNIWLKELEQLASLAEHVLDEINYEMLRRIVEDQNPLKAKVRFMSSYNTNFFQWKMARKFKEINTEFELINKKASALGLQSRGESVASTTVIVNPEKDSLDDPIVVGREIVESRIVETLLSPSNELLSFIPIIGMGGLGKTTLAKRVYNHHKLINHFGEKIWVSVSDHFEPKRIFKLILESLTSDVRNFEARDAIVQRIKEELGGKKYLLVLDDVWNENIGRWDDLMGSLAGISSIPGNWIIVTTRKQQVASNLSPRFDFYLEKLSDEDCLCIVKKKALLCEEGIEEFEAIKGKITELCQGLPLAARVIGGLLRTNRREQWHSVLQGGISNMNGDEYSSVMQILKISFDRLSFPYLKKCFAYCSLFEKDSRMEKRQLIELWMAEGFLQPTLDNDMETGNHCINILLQSSLLQEVTDKAGNPDPRLVQMHDLVHDLAKLISKPKNDVKDFMSEDRYLVVDSLGEETKTLPKMRMLRTLFLGSSIRDDTLMKFKHLHVLKLSCVEKELPFSIGKLIHLRYLEYSSDGVKALPESLCKLYNLQTLNVFACYDLEAFPKGMTKLISLKHLHFNSNCRMPLEMGRLTSLQTLEDFHVSEENQIEELGCLKNLRGKLTIFNLERVSSKGEALRADLHRKPINMLEFVWHGDGGNDEGVLDGLQPHPDLQELTIKSFSRGQFPSWLGLSQKLDKLVSLCIVDCKRCKQLPITLGQLPSLKYLKLRGLDNINCVDRSFYGINDYRGSENDICNSQVSKKIFPSLKKLWVSDMKNLKDWMEPKVANPQAVEMFPNLEHLYINGCRQLNSAPIQHFQNLKRLDIFDSGLNHVLPIIEIDQNHRPSTSTDVQKEAILTHLESLHISNCRNIRELPECLYELQKLRSLNIDNCSSLMSLPVPTRQPRLTSLNKLFISGCARLTSIPANLLQSCASLGSLIIIGCSGLTNLPNELLNSCISLERLDIEGCDSLTSIPTDFLKSSSSSLRSLSFSNLPNLNSVPFDLQQMPSLSFLNLSRLPILITLPLLLPSHFSRLSYLRIGGFSNSVEFDFDWSALSSFSSSLCKLRLECWPNLVSLPDPLQHLTTLRDLVLDDLKKIKDLPDWFSNLVSLEELLICDCAKLCYLPDVAAMGSLTKLSSFCISGCPLLKERCSRGTSSDSEWAKISHIPYIRIDGKRIKSVN